MYYCLPSPACGRQVGGGTECRRWIELKLNAVHPALRAPLKRGILKPIYPIPTMDTNLYIPTQKTFCG